MSGNIVVVGSCMIDFVSYAPKLPKAGETIHGTKFQTGFGGKGANQCAAAAKLGGKTSLVARLGDDSWGKDYLKTLKDLKVNTSHTSLTENQTSGIAQITVEESGQNQIVIIGGANTKLNEEDVKNAASLLSEASVVVCQLETSTDVALKAIQLCKGVSILNGAPAIPNCNPLLFSTPTIFCVNETEAAIFTGLPVENINEAEKAVECLIQRGCKTVILTLGSEGALLASRDSPKFVHIPSPKVASVDTTGAGDSFIGALAHLIADFPTISLEKKVEISSCMAANSVTKPGTQISFPDSTYLQHILKKKNLI